jgi:hypothetical protein
LTSYLPKMIARDDQSRALKKARGRAVFGYLMAMRTGKTKVAIDEFGEMELAGEVKDLFVEAPGGVYHTWEQAIREHASEDLLDRAQVMVWESGMGNPARKRLESFLKIDDPQVPRIFLMNCEAISRPGDARKAAMTFLSKRRGKRMMDIDESTLNKNHSAKRTKFNNVVLRPMTEYRRIMSGLVSPKSPLDLFSQFEFLDWKILGFKSFVAYRSHFAVMRPMEIAGRWIQVVDGYKNIEEIPPLIDDHTYRVEFRPKIPPTFSTWDVELTGEQKRIYKEMREDATARLDAESHVTATAVIAQMHRLHQILCGHTVDEDGCVREFSENRTQAVLDILGDYSGKAVVWCSYDLNIRRMSAALRKEYGEASVAHFWGGNVKTREEEEHRFKTRQECRFMIATPDAGRFSRDWSAADLAIYFSYKNNLEHSEQSEQRTQSVVKDTGVDNIYLLAKDTAEMPILEATRAKKDMSRIINGDEFRKWIV